MGPSTQIMGGSFRRGLHSKVVTFSTRLADQPSPLYKSNGKKGRWQPPIFVSCLLIGPNGFTLFHACMNLFVTKGLCHLQSHDKIKFSYSVVCPIVVYNGVVAVQEGAWGENPACREVAPCNPGSSVPACRAAVCAAVFVQPDMQFHHPLHAITT